jgi:hypothetical protein
MTESPPFATLSPGVTTMTSKEQEYHALRLRQERDAGLLSKHMAAARAHLQLADLHGKRLLNAGVRIRNPLMLD